MTVSAHLGPLQFPVVYLNRSNFHLLQMRATAAVDTVMFAYACTVPFGRQRCYRIGSGPARQVHMSLADWLKASMSNCSALWTCKKQKYPRGYLKLSSSSPRIVVATCKLLRLRQLTAIMAKNDVSDPDLSNPDQSALNPTEDDTTNLNPSKPDISKPDPPHPDLLKPAPSIPAPSPLGLGRGVEEPAIALLREINASLRELKDFSAKFLKLVDLAEAEDLRRRTDRNNTRLKSPSILGSIGSRTTDSASHGNIPEAEQGRRDRRGTTGSDDSDINAVNEESTQSSEEGTWASIEGALKGYNQFQTRYGDLPHPCLFRQIFAFDLKGLDDPSSLSSTSSRSRDHAYSLLREKDLIFSRDERCGFRFDTVALRIR